LALLVVIPHTTSTRGSDWEVALPKSYLKPGAFHLQQITSVPLGRLEYRMGKLDEAEFAQIRRKLRSILAL
jgi:mRNA interferase MazF